MIMLDNYGDVGSLLNLLTQTTIVYGILQEKVYSIGIFFVELYQNCQNHDTKCTFQTAYNF